MNFIILGAGAVGCYLGSRLAAGGRRVTMVGRPRTIEALAEAGLRARDPDGGEARVPARQLGLATSLASVRMDTPLALLLCVKGSGTESAALEIGACCPGGTTVVSMQNGVDNVARIRAIAPRMRLLAGMVGCHIAMPEPGRVQRTTPGDFYLERAELTGEIARVFQACGLRTRLSGDMRALQWGGLLLNLNNPVNALSELPLRAQLQDRDYRCVLAGLQQEALGVLRRAGIRPGRVAPLPPSWLPHLLRLPDWLFQRVAARLLRIDDTARASMWDELQPGRGTEIHDLCGAVVRLAAQHGMAAPRNAAMCEMVAAQRRGWRLSGPERRRTTPS